MVVIRLSRGGAKKRPFYRIVAADKRAPRDGRFIEKLGHFNPLASGKDIPLHMEIERVDYWLKTGAQPSDRVKSLIKQYKKENGIAAETKPAKKKAAKKTDTKAAATKKTAPAKKASKKEA